jgi:membrane protease subunit (stomatin/prohibitin family)
MVQPLKTLAPQHMREPVAALLEFAIANGLARAGHDEGGFVSALGGMLAWVHGVASVKKMEELGLKRKLVTTV